MKKIKNILLILVLIPSLLFTSCKDEETVDSDSFETLKTYLLENDMDLDHIIKYHDAVADKDIKFVTGAPAAEDLDAFLAKYYIIDIRSADDFTNGHIQGASNVAPANGDLSGVIAKAAEAGDKQILVVCYTGQTACFVASCLRLLDYRDAQALKWGMSGWNAAYDKWTGNLGDEASTSENWAYSAEKSTDIFSFPTISSNLTDGQAILEAQVEDVLSAGFKGVNPTDALNTPANYHINNYFSETDFTAFGHIKDSYRINPLLLEDGSIAGLDPEAQVVTYCYTGQTSGVITAYLRVLGYNAFSLKFGMNGLYNSNSAWTTNQWGGDSNPKDLPTVTE